MKWAIHVAMLAALCGFSCAASLKLPSYLKKCSRSDPKLNECALKNGREAIPTLIKGDSYLRIPVLNPLQLEQVKVSEGTGGVKFTLTLNKASVYGVKQAEVTQINIDLNKKFVSVKLEIKENYLQLISKYVVDGKILLIPIRGEGDFNLTLNNARGEFKTNFDLVKHEDGLEYIKLKDSELQFEIDQAYFDLQNLFNGDKALGDNMNMFLNENWQEVYKEVKDAVIEVLKTLILEIISKVTDKVAYDVIFDPSPYLKGCSKKSLNLNACALKSTRDALPTLSKGDPSLHIPPLNPLHLDRVVVDQGSGPVRFSLTLTDLRVHGLDSADLQAVDFDLEKKNLETRFLVRGQAMYLKSKYQIDGQVLILPIKGDGDLTIKLDTFNGTFKSAFDLAKLSDGLEHMSFRDSTFDFAIKRSHFEFKNLFNGDKALGDNMNVFLNENWQEVHKEISPVVSEVVRKTLVNILQDISSVLPYDVMFPA
ncbi:uncharacterized protein LOC134532292 [Bacillus rossius redtenbacheri]|uniref:uncharacterized protein LOC134532292 n=1 Tax=Bacillus rossius redtenbacheri TaxID=93214 RepID=UPI002FDCEFA6